MLALDAAASGSFLGGHNQVQAGRATPSAIISHELARDEAPQGDEQFAKRADGWTKVVRKPGK